MKTSIAASFGARGLRRRRARGTLLTHRDKLKKKVFKRISNMGIIIKKKKYNQPRTKHVREREVSVYIQYYNARMAVVVEL